MWGGQPCVRQLLWQIRGRFVRAFPGQFLVDTAAAECAVEVRCPWTCRVVSTLLLVLPLLLHFWVLLLWGVLQIAAVLGRRHVRIAHWRPEFELAAGIGEAVVLPNLCVCVCACCCCCIHLQVSSYCMIKPPPWWKSPAASLLPVDCCVVCAHVASSGAEEFIIFRSIDDILHGIHICHTCPNLM